MAQQKRYAGKIKRTGQGTFELLRVTMELTEQDIKSFRKNPELFFANFLETQGQEVNEVIAGTEALKEIRNRLAKRLSGPITVLVTVLAHIREPRRLKSKHIIVVTPEGL